MQTLKCLIVGNSKVGKTDIFLTYTTGVSSSSYTATVFDTYAKQIEVDGVSFNLGLWDSAGDKLYDEIRPISYPHTDCFIVCFSVDDRSSFDSVESKWKPEILKYGDGPKVPIILVSTKADLKDSVDNPITSEEVEDLRTRIGALAYMDCSSKTNQGIEDIFSIAVEAAISKRIEDEKPPDPVWDFEDLKMVMVGDGAVGKSSILSSYTTKYGIDENHIPTNQAEPHYQDVVLDGIEYFLGLIDLPCSDENHKDIRISQYSKANCVILCYAINDLQSFANIENKWVPELEKYCPDIPIVLVGNKVDLRKNSEISIPTVEGEEAMLSIGAAAFLECSARTGLNLSEIFLAAVQASKKGV